MNFESGGIYHIYNQGNNRQKIFFTHENYIYFQKKIKEFIKPYGNILAWCLMPNHFHLMVEVESVELPVEQLTLSQPFNRQSHPMNNSTKIKFRTLNESIGIMLRSYTRAINIQENRTGSLFRVETKAICLNEIKGVSSNWYTSFGVTFMNVQLPELRYPQVCFNYIHANPLKAGLTERPEDWEFSSYADLIGKNENNLINHKRVEEIGLMIQSSL